MHSNVTHRVSSRACLQPYLATPVAVVVGIATSACHGTKVQSELTAHALVTQSDGLVEKITRPSRICLPRTCTQHVPRLYLYQHQPKQSPIPRLPFRGLKGVCSTPSVYGWMFDQCSRCPRFRTLTDRPISIILTPTGEREYAPQVL